MALAIFIAAVRLFVGLFRWIGAINAVGTDNQTIGRSQCNARLACGVVRIVVQVHGRLVVVDAIDEHSVALQ